MTVCLDAAEQEERAAERDREREREKIDRRWKMLHITNPHNNKTLQSLISVTSQLSYVQTMLYYLCESILAIDAQTIR